MYLVPRDGELSAASNGEFGVTVFRGRAPVNAEVRRRGFVEHLLPYLSCDVLVCAGDLLAARGPIATEIDVALLLDEGNLEVLQGVYVVVKRGVGVPGG